MQTDEKLEKRIAYERMLAGISERAVLVDDLHDLLNESLKSMGSILDVSRAFIFTYYPKSDIFSCACEWDSPGTATLKDLNELTLSIPWATQQLKNGSVINYQDTREMPGVCYRERLLAAKVESTLNVPMFVRGELYGFMGFDECRFHRKWIDEDLYILTTAAQIITRAIENKKYEEALEEHRSRLESIFSSVQDAIITVDTKMHVIEANKAAEQICGIKITTGKPFTDCTTGCDRSCVNILNETLLKKDTVREYKIECRHPERKNLIAAVNCSPLLNHNGNFMGAVLVIRDITRLTHLEKELKERQHYQNIIGKSERMQKIYSLLKSLANMGTTVLITGESGTGKELVARALHYGGPRASKPFVTVNCSALAENLLESELFGHAKGAFTGADKDRMGRFEAADGGTIVLDEIGDISPLIQLKLLRVLQTKQFERVGELTPRKVDVRVVASTNRDLRKEILAGRFREDLYYRLNVMDIEIPPLRERYEDLSLLVDHFLKMFNRNYHKGIENLSAEVMQAFMNYPWPGNIRELEHAIERAFVLCQDRTILLEHIPAEITSYTMRKRQHTPHQKTADNPNDLLVALEKTDWNISKAARILGLSRWTVYRRIEQLKIGRPVRV